MVIKVLSLWQDSSCPAASLSVKSSLFPFPDFFQALNRQICKSQGKRVKGHKPIEAATSGWMGHPGFQCSGWETRLCAVESFCLSHRLNRTWVCMVIKCECFSPGTWSCLSSFPTSPLLYFLLTIYSLQHSRSFSKLHFSVWDIWMCFFYSYRHACLPINFCIVLTFNAQLFLWEFNYSHATWPFFFRLICTHTSPHNKNYWITVFYGVWMRLPWTAGEINLKPKYILHACCIWH